MYKMRVEFAGEEQMIYTETGELQDFIAECLQGFGIDAYDLES